MKSLLSTVFIAFMLMSCAQQQESEETTVVYQGPETKVATAVIHPTEGNSIQGTVMFTETEEGVRVEAEVSGLGSQTLHGFHIHEYGDCRAADGTSAGGHYNPEGMEHGAPTDDERHIGDLGNLPSNEDGVATVDFVDPMLSLSGENSIVGYGVIVHAGEDDLVTQPTGAAGPRLGCGVIGIANPDM
jgi:Cu-Zn family superoxide dismutase